MGLQRLSEKQQTQHHIDIAVLLGIYAQCKTIIGKHKLRGEAKRFRCFWWFKTGSTAEVIVVSGMVS